MQRGKSTRSTPARPPAAGQTPRRSGRPPKFAEPRRPITVTLPERTLAQLESIDTDRALAIARAAEAFVGLCRPVSKNVELIEIAPGKAMIFVGPSPSLRRIPWLQLLETTPGRNLLIIPSGTAVDSLEVEILDLLEKGQAMRAGERSLLEELRSLLGTLRRTQRISKAEIIVFDTRGAANAHRRDTTP